MQTGITGKCVKTGRSRNILSSLVCWRTEEIYEKFHSRMRSGILSNCAANNNTNYIVTNSVGKSPFEKLMLAQLAKEGHLFSTTTRCITTLTEFRQIYCTIYMPITDLALLHREWTTVRKLDDPGSNPREITRIFLFIITGRTSGLYTVSCSSGVGKYYMGRNRAERESAHSYRRSMQNGTVISHRPVRLSMARKVYCYILRIFCEY